MEQPEKHNARVFFALWPNAAERRALAGWQKTLQHLYAGCAMRADTLHVTLVFLGNVALERLDALFQVARETHGKTFELKFDEARFWKHNHIVHAAPSVVPQQLAALVSSLENNLRKSSFRFDQRPYRPHVTLLRNARWSDEPSPSLATVHWRTHEFVLVRSLPDEGGAHYEVLDRFPLR